MIKLPTTHSLDGFCDTLELLLKHARAGSLVAVSINLNPDGLGHYGYKLLDGTAPELADPFDHSDSETPPTVPARGRK